MLCSVVVFPEGLSWNCVALLPRGGRVSLSLYLPRPRNDRRRVRSLMFRIRSTQSLLRLGE